MVTRKLQYRLINIFVIGVPALTKVAYFMESLVCCLIYCGNYIFTWLVYVLGYFILGFIVLHFKSSTFSYIEGIKYWHYSPLWTLAVL